MRFVPENKEALDQMFKAMNECQLLHPDPVDAVSEEDEIDEEEDEEDEGEENGNSVSGTNGSQSQNLQAGEEPMDE